LNGLLAVGSLVLFWSKHVESVAAMFAFCWSSFAIYIGAAAASVVQL